jgi:hypothetical protein
MQSHRRFGIDRATSTGILLATIWLSAACGGVIDSDPSGLETQIDHIIWAVPDLEAGSRLFEEMSGVTPAVGGVHPGRGTRNRLAAAGERMYFEIIAPDPAQMPFDPEAHPVQAFADTILRMPEPEVDMFAYSTSDLDAAATAGRELGLQVVGPTPGERITPEGVRIRWSHVDFLGHEFGQFIPFAIDWLDSPHPSTTSPQGAIIEGVTVVHPRADELREIYEALGVPARIEQGSEPAIVVHMRSEEGRFEVTSGRSLFEYYRARSDSNIQ